jgi:hypothetical protein
LGDIRLRTIEAIRINTTDNARFFCNGKKHNLCLHCKVRFECLTTADDEPLKIKLRQADSEKVTKYLFRNTDFLVEIKDGKKLTVIK